MEPPSGLQWRCPCGTLLYVAPAARHFDMPQQAQTLLVEIRHHQEWHRRQIQDLVR